MQVTLERASRVEVRGREPCGLGDVVAWRLTQHGRDSELPLRGHADLGAACGSVDDQVYAVVVALVVRAVTKRSGGPPNLGLGCFAEHARRHRAVARAKPDQPVKGFAVGGTARTLPAVHGL